VACGSSQALDGGEPGAEDRASLTNSGKPDRLGDGNAGGGLLEPVREAFEPLGGCRDRGIIDCLWFTTLMIPEEGFDLCLGFSIKPLGLGRRRGLLLQVRFDITPQSLSVGPSTSATTSA
jgi:hypothetical protein